MTVVKVKKQKDKKSVSYIENYKNCLEATQLENKINNIEKNKVHLDSIKKKEIIKNYKEFIKNNK